MVQRDRVGLPATGVGMRFLFRLMVCSAGLLFPGVLFPGVAQADTSCGTFQPVGSVTIQAGVQNGGYNIAAGGATFTATMDWGDGGSSSVSVSPDSPSATLTHLYTVPGTYVVTLSVSGQLGDEAGTPCSDTVTIATATVLGCTASAARAPGHGSPLLAAQPTARAAACPTAAEQAAAKEKFKAAVANEADNAQWTTLALSVCAFVGATVPGAQPLLVPCSAYGFLSAAISIKLNTIARVDPPDPNWHSIVTPHATFVPVKSGGALTPADASALNAILRAQAVAASYMDAFMTSVNRESSAAAAHSTLWAGRQTSAKQRFAISAANALGQAVSLSTQAASQLGTLHIGAVSLAGVEAEQKQIAANGLPSTLVRLGMAMGLGQAGLASLKNAISSANFNTLAANYPGLLANPFSQVFAPSEVAVERSEQAAFLTYGRFLARFTTPKATSSPVNLSGAWQPSGGPAPAWKLTSSADRTTLTGSWRGGPGHTGLLGSFTAKLSSDRTSYSGTLHITEGSLSVNGTITFKIVSANSLLVTYKETTGPHGTFTLTRVGG